MSIFGVSLRRSDMAAPIRLKFGVDESTPHVKFHHHTEWGWGIRPKIVNCTKFGNINAQQGCIPYAIRMECQSLLAVPWQTLWEFNSKVAFPKKFQRPLSPKLYARSEKIREFKMKWTSTIITASIRWSWDFAICRGNKNLMLLFVVQRYDGSQNKKNVTWRWPRLF